MSETKDRSGQCLCGGVRITAKGVNNSVGACHCDTCRRWGGGPFMVMECGSDVSVDGPEHLSIYDSSPWAERGFCSKCGSHLFYRLKDATQYYIPVGLFDADKDLVFDQQVFIDEKPGFYRFANKTKDLTGAEIAAMFESST